MYFKVIIFPIVGGVPPSRWIVNYDFDLLDGLVIGAVLGAHLPFLVSASFTRILHVILNNYVNHNLILNTLYYFF